MSFIAKYHGTCNSEDCSAPIDLGDEVEYHDDELMHVGCASRERRRKQPGPRCDECGLHHRGEC